MSEGQLISAILLIGSLILVGSGLRSFRIGGRKMIAMALVWAGIIGVSALVFASMQ